MTVLAAPRLTGALVARCFALLAAAYVLFSFAAYVAVGTPLHAVVIGALGLIPIVIYVSLRWPIYFPFSLYALLVPVEALLRTGGTTGPTLTKFASFAVGLAFLARIVLTRRALLPPRPWFAWAAFVFLALASAGWSVYQTETLDTVAIVLQLFLLYTIAAIYPMSALDAVRLRRVIEAVGVLVACYGCYAYLAGQRLNGTRLSLSGGKFQIDPNHYGAFFIIPMSLLMARVLTDRRVIVRVASAAAFGFCALNVFFTGSRGVFTALACVLVYLAVRTRNFIATAAMAVVFIGISIAVPNTWQRFMDPSQGDASGRTDIWNVGLHAFPHFWLYGSGFATYEYVYSLFLVQSYQRQFAGWDRPSHSLVLGTSVELGIIGLGLVLLAWFLSLRQTWSVRADHPLAPIAYGAEGACVGLFVAALTLDMLWFKYLWLAFMLGIMTSNAIAARNLWAPRLRRPVRPLPRVSAGVRASSARF
ncbi:MAG: O-antigen ligase family protein [Candidatus Eremiobacteraeota bacterium]|nr:O-antigen ligase family protein [Candidatus Eremiobacteraeota bacterium]MBC5821479.1 O-antigen ligase family protein [Candidatus Eremiobacteraeota bacterium]